MRLPYNVSVLNCEAALFALEHADVFAAQAAELRAQRTVLIAALRAPCPASKKVGQRGQHGAGARADAAKAYEGMKTRKVLIKNVSTMHPLLHNCLRLTVGNAQDNAQMLAAPRPPMTFRTRHLFHHRPHGRPHRRSQPQHRRDAHHRAHQPDGTGRRCTRASAF